MEAFQGQAVNHPGNALGAAEDSLLGCQRENSLYTTGILYLPVQITADFLLGKPPKLIQAPILWARGISAGNFKVVAGGLA